MKTSKEGLAFTAASEGVELKAYKDTGGVWTIGVGHTSDENLEVVEGLRITKEKAMELLALDIVEAEEAVERLVKVPLTQGQFDALVDFTFNLGATQVGRSTLLKKLNEGDYVGAGKEFKRWVYDNGVMYSGLVKRRHGNLEQWNS